MAKRGDPEVLKYVVRFLRFHAGRKSQNDFGEKAGVSQSDLSDYEAGKKAPPEAALRRMARTAGLEWSLVVHVRRFYTALISAARHRVAAADPAQVTLDIAQLSVASDGIEEGVAAPGRKSSIVALREAEEVWAALDPLPMRKRRRLLGFALRASRSWALAVRVCTASVRAAAHKTDEALDLADLALFIAERVAEEGSFQRRLLGFCWLHIGNARRVANDFEGADQAFTMARDLWKSGTDPEGLLPEWGLHLFEAALRREQRQFSKALVLFDQAFASRGDDRSAAAMILLEKERVFDQMGEFEAALAVLDEAEAPVEASCDPHLLLSLRFKTARNFCYMERYAEAAELLPKVRELAEQQRNALDLTRLDRLEAKTLAGLGQKREAMERLEQVQRVFTAEELPYDAALSGLDLAVLWLEAGRAKEDLDTACGSPPEYSSGLSW